jgi:protein-tyrosine phosphatase
MPLVEFGDRLVPFETSVIFRDVGGYATVDGYRVRSGSVFRSDTLHRLTSADLELASEIGIRTVIDLRSRAELERSGRFGRAHEVAFHHLPVEEEIPADPASRDLAEPPPGEIYVEMATAGRAAIANILRVIAEGEHAVVFHCFAGKDRTGVIAALLLATLGVPDETIVTDYQLSERSLEPAVAWAESNDPEWAARMAAFPPWLLLSPAETMRAFLEILRARHGSIDAYLRDAGVEHSVTEVLRDRLLER